MAQILRDASKFTLKNHAFMPSRYSSRDGSSVVIVNQPPFRSSGELQPMWELVDGSIVPEPQRVRLRDRFKNVRPVLTRKSDNPLGAIWRSLQRYSGLQCARLLFSSDVSDDSIKDFCAYIELADSYSSLAEEADATLDPLLMYYAAMWLSRAIIAVRLGLESAAEQKTHGAKSNPGIRGDLKMLGGALRIGRNGTIPALVEALAGNVTPKQTFRLVDLLRGIPQMDDILRDALGEATSAVLIHVHPDVLAGHTGGHQVLLNTEQSLVNLLPIAPALAERETRVVPQGGGAVLLWESTSNILDELATLFIESNGDFYAETRIDGSYIPEFGLYLMVLYALSEFTRYYPRQWLDVYSGHDADYALVREFMHLAERRVPELALAEFSGTKNAFRHD